MAISEVKFMGAKYHDIPWGLYSDELPDGYYEKDGDIYLVDGDRKSDEIILLK